MFSKKIDEKIRFLFIIIVCCFILIILRVFYVQLIDYKKLHALANDLWSRDLPIEANRGLILDRNGVVLADNLTTTSLVLIPNQIEDADKTSSLLADILGVSKEEMDQHVKKQTSIERVLREGRSCGQHQCFKLIRCVSCKRSKTILSLWNYVISCPWICWN